MSALTKIRMGLLLAKIKLGRVFTMDWEKDPDPENWRTINGSHVHLENGKINGGAGGKFAGNDWVGKKMHASDPRAQQGSLFGHKYGWHVEPSRTEKEAKANHENLKKEVEIYNELNSTRRNPPWAKLEAQEKKVFEHLKNFSKESEEYKDALNNLGWTEEDVQSMERAENERQAKLKSDWEQAMAENEAAAKQKGGTQPEEKQYYSPLEAVAKLREMRKAQSNAKKTVKGQISELLKKETGLNVAEHEQTLGKQRRGELKLKWHDLDKGQQEAIKALEARGDIKIGDNGGMGVVISLNKPPQEKKATGKFKPTERTAAPEGYGEYLKRKNSGQMNSYEESQEARRERYENRSAAASKESEARFNAARGIQSNIPFGQPILVGHHSEARHRADLNRIENNMNKAFEANKKADYYSRRAESVGTAGISSLDPDAKYKVYEKLRDLEELQDKMKEANAKTPDKKPYASYQLVNNGAEIRRLRKRLDELGKVSSAPTGQLTNNALYELSHEDGRYQFRFDGKPSDEVRSILKSNGFKWSPSRGTWVRASAGSGERAIQDNGDMTIDVVVIGINDQITQNMIQQGMIVPKPQSVGIKYSFASKAVFGYDMENDLIKGYDHADWAYSNPLPSFSYDKDDEEGGMLGYNEGYWT